MSFNAQQFRELVVRPTLMYLAPVIPYSEEAEDLLVMTAAHESHLGTYLKQLNGPALGVYQMEPATHDDIWYNYLLSRYDLRDSVLDTADVYVNDLVDGGKSFSKYATRGLVHNLAYATAMARVHYFRVPEALPSYVAKSKMDGRDSYIWELAKYAKRFWNTELGSASVEDYYVAYNRYCQ